MNETGLGVGTVVRSTTLDGNCQGGACAPRRKGTTTRKALLVAGLVTGMLPGYAMAHIKWFHQYDLTEPPRSLTTVLGNETFLPIFVASVVVLFLAAALDSWLVARNGIVSRSFGQMDDWFQDKFYPFIRILTGVFFIVLGMEGGILLTPELKTSLQWIPLFQIAIGVLAIFPFTGVLAGIGILLLYGMCIGEYGVFHMCDYPAFIGAAVYLMWMSLDRSAHDKGIAVLRVATGLTLMIGATEKFGYPQWSFDTLKDNPVLTFGITNYEFYMVGAGMVEFSLAFLVVTGRFSGKAGSAILFALMTAGILLFGWIDAVGHALFLAALFALTLNRNNLIGETLCFHGKSGIWKTGALQSALFAALLLAFVQTYHLGNPGSESHSHVAESGSAHIHHHD